MKSQPTFDQGIAADRFPGSLSHPVRRVTGMARTTRLHPTPYNIESSSSSSSAVALPAARLAAMERAVELEVDAEEFGLRTAAESAVWEELVAEFEARVAREGRWWVAAA